MPSFPIRLFRWDFYLFGCPLGICVQSPNVGFASKGEILAASKYFPLFFQQQTFEEPLGARHLVDRAIPPVTWSHGCLRARKIWIDDALGGAARCRRVAQRSLIVHDHRP